jgi:hypothetical protein
MQAGVEEVFGSLRLRGGRNLRERGVAAIGQIEPDDMDDRQAALPESGEYALHGRQALMCARDQVREILLHIDRQ